MSETHRELRTSEVAKILGVRPDLLRKWKARGFLKLAPAGVSGQGRSVECLWSAEAIEEARLHAIGKDSRIAALEKELADLQHAKKVAEDERDVIRKLHSETLRTHYSQLSTAISERDAAREAMKPFVTTGPMADILWGDMPDDAPMTITVPLGVHRRARTLIEKGEAK